MRLYRIEISSVPQESVTEIEEGWYDHNPEWKPEGWEEFVQEQIEEGAVWLADRAFFWPSEKKLYRSRSSAAEKVAIVERWGGKATLMEAEVSDFIPVAEANALRKRRRDNARIEKLRQRIREIEES